MPLYRSQALNAAMVYKAADQVTADYSGNVAVTWDSELYDTNGWHEGVTNPGRLTVPAGVAYARVGCLIATSGVTANVTFTVAIRKNNSSNYIGAARLTEGSGSTSPVIQVAGSGPIPVVAGDYFEVFMTCSDTDITVVAATSHFWIEKVA